MQIRCLILSIALLIIAEGQVLASTVRSLYGEVGIDQPIVLELLQDPALQRLRHIDVDGPSRYFRALPPYSVLDHALGVYVLLKKFNFSPREQLAGLLQYASYSVFGDFGSFLYNMHAQDTFNVETEEDFMNRSKLDKILEKYHLTPADISPLKPEFKAIFAEPPDLSADMIEKTLRLAYTFSLITREDITKIITNLRYDHGRWYFVDPSSAHEFGMISLYFAEKVWGAGITFVINRWFGTAIKRAVELHDIETTHLRFGTDAAVLKALFESEDQKILSFLSKARQPYRFFYVVDDAKAPFDYLYKPKFYGLNPYVKVGEDYKRLSDIDPIFNKDFERVKAEVSDGIRIKYRDPDYPKGTGP